MISDLYVRSTWILHHPCFLGLPKQRADSFTPLRIGTVTESIDAVKLCKSNGWGVMCSHRSGETEETGWEGKASMRDLHQIGY